MERSSPDQELYDLTRCTICLTQYQIPKALPCLHTFCRGCLQKHIEAELSKSGHFTSKRFFSCPYCRRKIDMPSPEVGKDISDQFPTNYYVTKIMDSKGMKKKKLECVCQTHNEDFCQYCLDHRSLLCVKCTPSHVQCNNVKTLSETVLDLQPRIEFLKNVLKSFESSGQNMLQNRQTFLQNLEKQKQKKMREIEECYQQILKQLKISKDATLSKLEEFHGEAFSDNKNSTQEIFSLSNRISSLYETLFTCSIKKDFVGILMSWELIENQLEEIEFQFQHSVKDLKHNEYKFRTDSSFFDVINRTSSLGTFKMTQCPVEILYDFCKPIQIEADIKGILTLSDGSFLITDCCNDRFLLMSTEGDILKETALSARSPWDICKIREDLIAITNPEEEKVEFFTFPELQKSSETTTKGSCVGVCKVDENLVVSFPHSSVAHVDFITLNGDVELSIKYNKNLKEVFAWPEHLTASEGGTIYVSDANKDCVYSLNQKGEINWTFQCEALDSPSGICVRNDGSVYVCGYNSKNIIHVNSSGKLISIKHCFSESLSSPWAVQYCESNGCIYVVEDENNVRRIRLFKV